MFKNVIMYRIAAGWSLSAEEIEARLQDNHFVECGASQEKSMGWVEPRGETNGPLLEVVAGQWIMKLMTETRALPASVVNRKAQERVAQIEASTGRKPRKKENRDLKDAILATTGPQYFSQHKAEHFSQMAMGCRDTVWGGDCYNYALLASGHIDLVVESGLKLHDIAALVPVVDGDELVATVGGLGTCSVKFAGRSKA